MQKYTYRRRAVVIILLLATIGTGIMTAIAFASRESDAFYAGVVGAFLTAWMVFMSTTLALLSSDVIISNDGIGRSLLGFRWQFSNWQQICTVRVSAMRDYASGQPYFLYSFDKEKWKPFFLRDGPILFTDRIRRASELVARVNAYLTAYKIPVVLSPTAQRLVLSERNSDGPLPVRQR